MNRKKNAVMALMAALMLGASALAAGGGADDPLVTVSYLDSIFVQKMKSQAQISAGKLQSAAEDKIGQHVGDKLEDAVADAVLERVSKKISGNPSLITGANMQSVSLAKGDKVTGPAGAGFVLVSGTANICGPAGSEVVNVTAAGVRKPGAAIRDGIYYMIVENNGSGIEITSDSATVLIKDGAQATGRYTAENLKYAEALHSLGLFLGSNKGYELERQPTRQEALIMLIRLLGEEKQALSYSGSTKFTDLTGWGDGQKYIIYGENMGYTNGDGASTAKFSQYRTADCNMYLTFVLRALGYDDAAGDFVWNQTSKSLAQQAGLVSQQDLQDIESGGLRRDHVVKISFNALSANIKGTSVTLGQRLVQNGAVTQQQLDAALSAIK